ncbi:PREDICTED: uncharacterized protein At5g39865-like [Tarenaya hassleriana]|uniref:uncharacterized protein At5g39865-like n=1 Tax=Tarenaya hassleriana TaxID=28532 RepID=UPI00053C6BFA|nr:PREDICTED: uncharacterized protein At5g39865-like [Tarenaya hassleriana]XP_010543857.1 PREDICTED: uncharacterized protein At5g39865-like [Tarenaya hassleriana]
MKGMKERLVKKLRLITSVGTLKQGLALHHSPKHETKLQNQIQREEKPETETHDSPTREGLTPETEPEKTQESAEQDEGDDGDVLSEFEEKCPPGGEDSVVFYTTSLRGVRKTFEACRRTRFLLENHKASFRERDVSMDSGYREEMWRLLGQKVTPPRLFIRGKYIGGAEEAVVLNENGKLKKLLEGLVSSSSAKSPCQKCMDERFLICSKCNGSSRVLVVEEEEGGGGEGHETWRRCTDCNENGLVKCSVCS